ncbi:alpha-L-fucosidase [Lactobacillus gigeriorum]|uniref:alpha-L-fucosidase n=1 Tax=Lactobacillus gigeriorum DSM 23908 = CRBIP 24.85 TaxID=1423751 RepID=I7J1N8_9LACO|nr:alpha-L-fucosidase [Lactobacillus gigeriorum]KRN11947.1 glycoside hydrolase family 29 [Lactobacillus gigeriorum DSM 23908 = CRBIP 24.85]CCI86402.1 Alpha-L-fucosidase [Lactobacillus gigeriorum DSM 23908 = CRBIP 24.85]
MLKEQRIVNYEKMGLGLFIHWGLYSQLSQGEWTQFIHEIPKGKYESLIKGFKAEKYNAKEIVKVAKQMGAHYIILTAKHHEGFCLYDTKGLTTFDSIHSSAKRDLIKEFVDACHEANISPFLYMATYDWHNPYYENNFEQYLEYLYKSVKILCKDYGKIGGFWFDGNWNKPDANWKQDKLYSMIRKYQPDAMIINNTGLVERGKISNKEIDAVTYERGLPGRVNHGKEGEKYVAGEISVTLNQHWGRASMDFDYKSPKEIIETIVHGKKVGANTVVNIGPNGDGSINNIDLEYLKLIGKWTSLFSEAFYNGSKVSLRSTSNKKDFAIKVENTYYFFVHDLKIKGNSNVVLGGESINPKTYVDIDDPLKELYWLDNSEELKFIQNSEGIVTFDATGYRYGTDYVVRVAKGVIK